VGDIRHNVADLSKAQRLLGFAPRVGFASGIEQFANWVQTQEVATDGYEQSIKELAAKGLLKQ
jgi:dTDP-L-rhamnose 4-epimerase